jgi:hypothetical protein
VRGAAEGGGARHEARITVRNAIGARRQKTKSPVSRALESTTPQKSVISAYFFFDDDFFAVDFDEDPLDELFEADFFDAAISAHHLSCRTGPPGRAYLATRAGLLRQIGMRGSGETGDAAGRRLAMTCDVQ